MLRSIFPAAALVLSVMSMAQAANPASATIAGRQNTRASFENAAEKACNDALLRNDFGDYGTMEECVDATANKMMRAQAQGKATPQVLVESRTARLH